MAASPICLFDPDGLAKTRNFTKLEGARILGCTIITQHECVDPGEEEPVEDEPIDSGWPIWIRVLAGIGAVVVGVVFVITLIDVIPGDEVVVGAAEVALVGVAVGG